MDEENEGQKAKEADYKIVVDTREQNPLWKEGVNTVVKGLTTGDYSILGLEDKICIERKSLSDLFGTLGGGHTRFKKELDRAIGLDYFAIVIEGSYTDALNKNFEGFWNTKMKGFVITSILFTIHVKYKVPVFFCTNRVECKRVIKELLNAYYRTFKNRKLIVENQKV